MARILTQQEKQILQGSSDFTEKCQWAVRDYSATWANNSGAGLDDTQRIKWVKDRLQAKAIIKNDISDSSIALTFVKLGSDLFLDLPVTQATIQEMITSIEPSMGFLASKYFDLKGLDINF
jgi:hypothetical protein